MKTNLLPSFSVITVLIAIMLYIFSCTTPDSNMGPKVNTSQSATLEVKSMSGLLVLKSHDDFTRLVNQLNQMKEVDRIAYEKSFNFESLRTVSTNEDITKIDDQLTEVENDETVLHPFCLSYSVALNKQGMIIIGGQLMSFSKNVVKSISLRKSTGFDQAVQLLKIAQETDKGKGVFVAQVENQKPKGSANARTSGNGDYSVFGDNIHNVWAFGADNYRLEGRVHIYAYNYDKVTCDACDDGPGYYQSDEDCQCVQCNGCLVDHGPSRAVQITATAVAHMNQGGDDHCQELVIGPRLTTDFGVSFNSSTDRYNPGSQLFIFLYSNDIPTSSQGVVSGKVDFGCIFGPGQSSNVTLNL